MNWNETVERPNWPEELEEPVAKLGAPAEVYMTSRRKAFNKMLLGLALLVGGVGVNYVYFWVLGFFFVPDKFLMLLLFGTPIAGIGLIVNSFRDRGMWVLIYPMGLLRWHRNEVMSFPWDEIARLHLFRVNQCDEMQIHYDTDGGIESVALDLEGSGSRFFGPYFILRREDGASAYFPSSLEDYSRLTERVQRQTFARRWPKIWEDFRDGVPVPFGDLDVSLAGLSKGDDTLPWPAFGGAKIVGGKLIISRMGKWRAWHEQAIHEVADPHLLMALLKVGQPTPT